MIQSAMMFALGVFVSGLAWLALAVALVRRARRLTAWTILAGVSTRRAEFDTERDELRARHAVEMHRQGQEVSRVLDMATAYRLEADVKENDIASLRAELKAREEDLQDLEESLADQREAYVDLELRHAEAGAALRAAQHQLKLEGKRRAIAEEALNEASITGDQRRIELSALRAQNEALRTALGDRLPFDHAENLPNVAQDAPRPDHVPELPSQAPVPEPIHLRDLREAGQRGLGASVVPLRVRPAASAEQSAALVADAMRDLQRLAGDGPDDFGNGAWRASVSTDFAPSGIFGEPRITDLDLHRSQLAASTAGAKADDDGEDRAEKRFMAALSEIRLLKRASSKAGE